MGNKYLGQELVPEGDHKMGETVKMWVCDGIAVKVDKPINKVAKHQIICQEMNALYQRKNDKYGDSFHKTYEEYGSAMLCIRLDDKLARAKQLLIHGKEATDNESIRDTLIDLANYAIMGIMELEDEKNPTI
jgi:hypothetical protein